jgi:hypothetical protein
MKKPALAPAFTHTLPPCPFAWMRYAPPLRHLPQRLHPQRPRIRPQPVHPPRLPIHPIRPHPIPHRRVAHPPTRIRTSTLGIYTAFTPCFTSTRNINS